MARDLSNPPLLVRSERGTPTWMSPLEVMKLSIGMAEFTCCQRNHVITTETQKVIHGDEMKKIPCDKPIVGVILEQLIDAKIDHLFTDPPVARRHWVFKHWWLRGLSERRRISADGNESAVVKFKKELRWNDEDDEPWFDRSGEGVMMYAVTSDEIEVVRELLDILKQNFDGDEYTRRLESRVRKKGYIELGIPGGMTTLMAAMMTASTEVVSMLLDYGANVESLDVMGNDAFMFASIFGRPQNMQCWFERIHNYDLERRNTVLGATSLIFATNMGRNNKFHIVNVLCEKGADVETLTHTGFSVLIAACANEDSDPRIVRDILRRMDCSSRRNIVNYRIRSQTIKWALLRGFAKLAVRHHLSKSFLVNRLAHGAGLTALHYAARRGDVEIVAILLKAGADPYIENEMGLNAFDISNKYGPYPSVMRVLCSYKEKQSSNSSSR